MSRMEIFSNIESQIERAVQLGQDSLIQSLDREIDPLLEDILHVRPTDTVELMRQLKFITDLLVRRSDDAATVVRLSAKLSEMINYYFQEDRLRLREERAGSGNAQSHTTPVDPMLEGAQTSVARVAVISTDFRFLYCNSVMAGDLHVSPQQLVGCPVSEFCNERVFQSSYRNHLDMALAGDFREFDAPCLTGEEGSQTYQVRLTPLRNIERRITGAVMVAQIAAELSKDVQATAEA